MKEVAPTCDILLAHRYLYWCAKSPIISDKAYDDAKAEEIEYGGAGDLLKHPAFKKVCDYPDHIRSLALYMLFKFQLTEGKRDWNQLPHSWGKSTSHE